MVSISTGKMGVHFLVGEKSRNLLHWKFTQKTRRVRTFLDSF